MASWLCLLLVAASPTRPGPQPCYVDRGFKWPNYTCPSVQRAMITVLSKSGIKPRHPVPGLSNCPDFMSFQERFWARIGGARSGPSSVTGFLKWAASKG